MVETNEPSERIAVVDGQNRFVRFVPRAVIHQRQLVHRSIHVAIFDSRRRLLLQRRHRDKDTYPRFWDISCAGHVSVEDYPGDIDATREAAYRNAAQREVGEELGVTPLLSWLAALAPIAGVHYEQIHLFRGTSDGPYRFPPEEVEELRAVSTAELAEMRAAGEPLTRTLISISALLRQRGLWVD